MNEPKNTLLTRGFSEPSLPEGELSQLSEIARQARGDILMMTTLGGSGHPGGSLSSIDIYTTLWGCTNVSPALVNDPARDRIVISHGHTAPAVYAALGRSGFFDPMQAVCGFRSYGSVFEGHADPKVPGVEWACGNLGQGLSAACGFALSSVITGVPYRTYCVMGDGEQQKGQIAEARRFAAKYRLDNLVAIIDCNDLQAMGSIEDTMPQDLAAEWEAAGWRVLEVDGHDFGDIYRGLAVAKQTNGKPTVILARTIMGKGVSFIEDRYEYHGKILDRELCKAALCELGLGDRILPTSEQGGYDAPIKIEYGIEEQINASEPRTYDKAMDCRSALGLALEDIARQNDQTPIAVFDCDLSASVKTDGFAKLRPDGFFQCGIQEHSTATIAGAVSKSGVLSFFADFGVFGIDEAFNQHRLNDINDTSLKLICTHCGLDVGEDGKTHQCIDYIGQFANLFGFKLIVPADANQTDRVIRYIATHLGRFVVAMGRSKCPIISDDCGSPIFVEDFEYGKADWVRRGDDCTIITAGNMVHRAVTASEILRGNSIHASVINLSCPLDIDSEVIDQALRTGLVVTYEDHHIRTGIGSLIASYITDRSIPCELLRLGVSEYGVSASPEENYRRQGLLPEQVAELITDRLRRKAQ